MDVALAQKFVDEDDEYLLSLLIPESERALFSPDGAKARGFEIFKGILVDIKTDLCALYLSKKDAINSTLDFIATVSPLLDKLGMPVDVTAAIAALIVRYGIGKICSD